MKINSGMSFNTEPLTVPEQGEVEAEFFMGKREVGAAPAMQSLYGVGARAVPGSRQAGAELFETAQGNFAHQCIAIAEMAIGCSGGYACKFCRFRECEALGPCLSISERAASSSASLSPP
jgi:hypothetical protein